MMFYPKIGLIFLYLSLFACGKEEGVDSLTSLKGTSWHGQFQKLGAQEQKTEPVQVAIDFGDNGSFRTLLLKDPNLIAKGDYRDMPRHSTILLDVTESNFEGFSLRGSSKTLEYSLVEDELILKNHEELYTLVRKGSADADPTNPFIGAWTCEDNSEGLWSVDFEENTFFARRSQSGTRALHLRGGVTYTKSSRNPSLPDLGEMVVVESSHGSVANVRLQAEIEKNSDHKKLTITEYSEQKNSPNKGLNIHCVRAAM